MKLATCRSARRQHAAVVREGALGLLPLDYTVAGILERKTTEQELMGAVSAWVAPEDVEFLPPVLRPDKILCVGINFPDHASEIAGAAVERPPYPSLFARFASSQVGHGTRLQMPSTSQQFDFEGELAVVIGAAGRALTRAEAMSVVGGYSCFAENSVRDFQAHSRQVTPGKNFQASGAFGPWVVTADELPDIGSAHLITRLNGQEMQRARLGTMLFCVADVVAYVSSFTTLLPGDVIAMGTPSGVGLLRDPPLWMKAGDVLEVEIEGIGVLRNRVTD